MRRDIQKAEVQKTTLPIVSGRTIYQVALDEVMKEERLRCPRVYDRDGDHTVVRGPGLRGYSRIIKEEGGRFTGLYPLNPEQRFPGPL